MPYIKEEQRKGIKEMTEKIIKELEARVAAGWYSQKDLCGNITYVVFLLIRHFYEDKGWYDKSDALKVCNSASHEFERRFIDPYEDKKIGENGDAKTRKV